MLPVLYLKRDITKPRAIKYRIVIRLKQFESCAISVKAFIPPYDCSILCIIYICICLFRMTNPLLRGHIQADVPAVRLKYNYVHITKSQYKMTGVELLTIRLTWIYRYIVICLLNCT